jgi:hypothetical protein
MIDSSLYPLFIDQRLDHVLGRVLVYWYPFNISPIIDKSFADLDWLLPTRSERAFCATFCQLRTYIFVLFPFSSPSTTHPLAYSFFQGYDEDRRMQQPSKLAIISPSTVSVVLIIRVGTDILTEIPPVT